MPKKLLAGLSVTAPSSAEFEPDCDQDMRWLAMLEPNGLDGTPHVYIEELVNGTWTKRQNPKTLLFYFELTEEGASWRDSYFMGERWRMRIDPNDNTVGTVTGAAIHYKSKV